MTFLIALLSTLVFLFLGIPVLLALGRVFGIYAIVKERTCRVYVLFGKVHDIIDEPGLYFLPARLGLKAFSHQLAGTMPCPRLTARSGISPQRARQLRGGRPDGHRNLV